MSDARPEASDSINIVVYRPEFAVTIADLFHEAIHSTAASYYSPDQLEAWAPTPPDYEMWARRLAEKKPLVALSGTTVIGFIELEDDGHIDCLYIHRDYQRRGVAARLYVAVEEIARSRGLKRLYVEASFLARPFFERQGFILVAQNRVERKGVSLTNFAMEKLLA